MALVHDDQVKEVFPEQGGEAANRIAFGFRILVLPVRQLLIQGEIHLIGRDCGRVILGKVHFMNDLVQRGKILVDGLIHKNIPVRQIQHLLHQATGDQTVDRLEGDIGLAGAGRKDQEQALFAAGDCLDGPIDRVPLIISRGIGLRA